MGIGAEESRALPATLDVSTPMLGRVTELDRLRALWSTAVAGRPGVVVVVRGPEGAGARRLVAALAQEVASTGVRVEVASGAEGPGEQGACPSLLVVPPEVATPAERDATLTVLLGRDRPVPLGAEVVGLKPLEPHELRELVRAYFPAHELEQQQAVVRVGSGGWPGRAHAECRRQLRRSASRRIAGAAAAAEEASSGLASARDDLREAVTAFQRAQPPSPALPPDGCPWRGAAPYDVQDAPWFAGRERVVADVISRLAVARVVGVVGGAGSGTSSLLRAGVLALLATEVLPGSAGWTPLVMHPGDHPLRALAVVALEDPEGEVDTLLCRLIRDDFSATPTVLVVDQLEELWTVAQDPAERAAFLALLVELVGDPRSSVRVLLGVRSAWLARVGDEPALAALLADNSVLVGRPTPGELGRIVDEPARRAGLTVVEGLTDLLVAQAAGETEPLPALARSLERVWRGRSGGCLTMSDGINSGGWQTRRSTLMHP